MKLVWKIQSSGSVAMLGKILIVSTVIGISVAELPLERGPYGPSGWKPQGLAFSLPNQYFTQQIRKQPQVELEITKQRVDHVSKVSQINSQRQIQDNAYLPPSLNIPSGVDILSVQRLPSSRPSAQFKVFRPSQLNINEFYPQRLQKLPSNFRQQQFSKQTLPRAPANQYKTALTPPATSYGVPEPFEPIITADQSEEEENENVNVMKGEYYVLTPENTFQKVSYTTSQTEEEAENNGFSAQLKYTPVKEINGPLYKYNDQGQLIRVLKK